MTDQQRAEAWNKMPEEMRKAIISLYQSYWLTFNTRKRLEEIYGRENLNPVIQERNDTCSN